MQKIVLITGVAGQDGSYPANLLLEKSNIVHQLKRSSLKRHSSSLNTERVDRRTSLTAYVEERA
jgi:GDPmannose 4,6-dehydratase